MMNETSATLAMPMWLIGAIMPIAAVFATLAVFESLRTRRPQIELSDLGLSPGQKVEADVAVPDSEQQP
ncbi:MAG: hypothetical protein E5X60_37620 [Mesorhizobium sp.]|nr:MAG: hypothetical protein E5X60_37620 [Mesorhizobium sp.]